MSTARTPARARSLVTDDTDGRSAVSVGEDTAQEALAEQETAGEPAASLLETPNPPAVAAAAPAAPRFERERPVKTPRTALAPAPHPRRMRPARGARGGRRLLRRRRRQQLAQDRAVPARRRTRQLLAIRAASCCASRRTGGLLKPTFSTAVGVDAANYVVVATYRISANVQADGSADRHGRQPPHRRSLRPVGRPRRRAHRRGAEAQGERPRRAGQGRRHDRPRLRLHPSRRQQRALRVRVPRAHRVLDRVLLGSRARQGA